MTGQWIDDKTYWEDPKPLAFALGDQVEKIGGRYGGPGRIVGCTDELDADGYRLYNVAMKVEGGYGEFVHAPAAALKKIEK